MKRQLTLLVAVLLLSGSAFAQPATDLQYSNDLQYYRAPGQAGLNVFEAPKMAGRHVRRPHRARRR